MNGCWKMVGMVIKGGKQMNYTKEEGKIKMDKFNDVEHLRMVLFMVARNNVVLPAGLKLGKPMEEINRMSYDVMLRLIEDDFIDFEMAKKSYLQGKEMFEKDRS